jgi:ribosome-binding factor A
VTSGNRPARVGAQIQKLLGELFLRGLRDPRIGMVTITGVEVTADLRDAKVFWTSHGTEAQMKATAAGLDAARGYLRREVGRDLGLRVSPELRFSYDEAIDRGERIDKLLREVQEENRKRDEASKPDDQ